GGTQLRRTVGPSRLAEPREAIRGGMARQRERTLDLARPLSRGFKLMLKISVGDADHRRDRVSIRFPSDVGDAVFRDNDVAERAGQRRVRIGPDYVALEPGSQMAPTAYGDDRPSVLELVRHGDEIVLASDAAHDAPIFQSV